MSSNYIRIYCNGVKARSTGKEKWQRDGVLKTSVFSVMMRLHQYQY